MSPNDKIDSINSKRRKATLAQPVKPSTKPVFKSYDLAGQEPEEMPIDYDGGVQDLEYSKDSND